MAPWPSGKAKVCNTSIPGPIPGGASKKDGYPNGYPSFLTCYARREPCSARRRRSGIRSAFLTKQRLPLASNLVGKNSALGHLPGGVPKRAPIFFDVATTPSDAALRVYAQNLVRKFGERTFRARTGTPRQI